jgi:hypothetical protein
MIVNGYIQASFDWRSIVENAESLKDKVVKVYLLAKEGISNPKILGAKTKPLQWTKDAIISLASKVSVGIQAFIGHGKGSNDHASRKPIGHLVGHAIKEIGGKLHHYVAIASDTDHNHNVISMEASVDYEDFQDAGIVRKVSELTGLALGIKGKDIPGVEGAEMVAQMQFFDDQNIESKPTQMRKKTMTKEEIKAAIKEIGGYPTDFFQIGEILGKISVKDGKIEFDGEGDPKIANSIKKYVVDQIQPVITQANEKLKEYEPIVAEHKTLKVDKQRNEAKGKIDEIVKNRQLTEQHKKYLESEVVDFDPDNHKLDEFIDNKLTKFKSLVDSGLIVLQKPDGTLPKPRSSDPEQSTDWEKDLDETIEAGEKT